MLKKKFKNVITHVQKCVSKKTHCIRYLFELIMLYYFHVLITKMRMNHPYLRGTYNICGDKAIMIFTYVILQIN